MSLLCSYEFAITMGVLACDYQQVADVDIYLMTFASAQNSQGLTTKDGRMETEEKLLYHIIYK